MCVYILDKLHDVFRFSILANKIEMIILLLSLNFTASHMITKIERDEFWGQVIVASNKWLGQSISA